MKGGRTNGKQGEGYREPRAMMEHCEGRRLLTTFHLNGLQQGDQVRLWWEPAESHLAFSNPRIAGGAESLIPGNVDLIQVDGRPGNNTLVADFINGSLSRPPSSPIIDFLGQAGDDNTLILGSLTPDYLVTMNPNQVIVHDTLTGFSTTINYGAGVSSVAVPEPLIAAMILPMCVERLVQRRRIPEVERV